jgi:hypothetical protein
MFNLGDWVQITPTPDYKWSQWYNSRDIYQEYLDKIGVIEFVADDDERPGESLYAVKVKFPFGLGQLQPGEYYEWFRGEHLIRSSKSNANLRYNMVTAGRELQEWERFKKKSTDDMLRKIFLPDPEPEEKKDSVKENKKNDDPNQWDIERYEDDYPGYSFEYTNNTDMDYSYYLDMSDAKSDDKD